MKFKELPVAGAFLIDAEPFTDERGTFRRHFCRAEYEKHGIDPNVAQGNISENPKKGTLRGIHFQYMPAIEGKTLSCATGAIFDIVVDLRPKSPTFLKWAALELSAKARNSLYVPAGCGNGWLTLEDHTNVHYYMTSLYEPGRDAGVRYNDPLFGFTWPSAPTVISAKDAAYPDLDPKTLKG